MKVFLSWSGEKSHKVAMVFRDWFPSVVQSLEPYVSSEDIDKGARWSTDIAKELENSSFGILCVTKDNIDAPWLTFEAGALSKTMDKSFVSPFLFDIKRSEVDGPILQFQSTIFEKEDIRKLLKTLNKAVKEDQLTEERINKAFEVWYPTLEEGLNKLKNDSDGEPESTNADSPSMSNNMLEEILDLSRINQKLIRNPKGIIAKDLAQIKDMQEHMIDKMQALVHDSRHSTKNVKMHPGMIDEVMHFFQRRGPDNYAGFLFLISLYSQPYPWLYDSGQELVRLLRSTPSKSKKREALESFVELIDFTFEHPIFRDMIEYDEEMRMLAREMPYFIKRTLDFDF